MRIGPEATFFLRAEPSGISRLRMKRSTPVRHESVGPGTDIPVLED